MAQYVSRGGSDGFPTEVLTVAELLSRNAGHERARPEPDTGGISVGALLRREGRAPHAVDRPLKPRPHQEAAEEESGTDRRVLVRRGAIAAGTLLAAGSVFGAAILTDVTPTANEAAGTGTADDEGSYPGQGLLDQQDPGVAPPDGVVIDQAAATDPLDPGTAAPSNWVPVAFPGALAGSESGTDSGSSADDAATDGGDPGSSGSSGSSGDDGPRVAATSGDDDENTRSSGDERASTSGSTQETASGGSDGGSSRGSDDRSGDREEDRDDDRGGLLDTVGELTGALLGGGDDDDEAEEESVEAQSFSLRSAGDEGSSAPQDDEDGSKSRSSDESGDDESDDSDSDSDSDSGDDDGGDRGLVGSLLGTVGGLLR